MEGGKVEICEQCRVKSIVWKSKADPQNSKVDPTLNPFPSLKFQNLWLNVLGMGGHFLIPSSFDV